MAESEVTILQFGTSLSAKVHPLVIFNICDCYVRRPDQAVRVIGTLLGSILPNGTVDIRNSFAVPYTEAADQVLIDIEYHHSMLISNQKVNPKEVIVGWYSTGFGVTGVNALIHDFYANEVSNPVHLVADTGFTTGKGSLKGFVSNNLSLGDRQLAAQFLEIPLDLRMVDVEPLGFDTFKSTDVDKLPNDLEVMEASMARLLTLIDNIYKYVDDVVEGRVTADNNIGRFILDTVAGLPRILPAAFDKLMNDSLQDQLMLLHLSSITRTHLSLAEKLNTAAQML